jgi:5-methylcytosine-specific restriction endonuclease McrBC GTP-binding regulatory subunit McrB
MNLARVEYYFSDLLSKLETRNGIDADNAIERRKAEIEIECNAADKIDSMRHLFVSPYTLFVGTMNEDESTQTLSDKVLDRANVLRFGLPKTLARTGNMDNMKNAPDKGGFIDSWRKDGRICAVEWDVWCKPLSRTTEEREAIDFLNRTVQPVLMALDKVNRAYGYRVDQAMKLYVLNYPGDYRHAVSDQLEMKILPKLNGVELQDTRFNEVRSALQTAIDATGDDSLKNAFATSCNADAAFFKWRGVMR